MRGKKGSVYDGGHRVPCFVHWPGEIAEGPVETLSGGYDLLPTLIDLCDLDAPEIAFDGTSLRGVLEGGDDGERDGGRNDHGLDDRTLFVDSQRVEWPEKWKDSAVMTDRWRLIRGEELYDVEADPGQDEDVADEHPDVVDRLRGAYEDWWADVGPFEEYARIPVGSGASDPAALTCHDWHDCDDVPWNQGHILEGEAANGFWTLEVADPGAYEIELRRWPPESDAPIGGMPADFTEMDYGSPGGGWTAEARAIDADAARIRIGGVEREKPVPDGATSVTFRVDLDAGDADLLTWFESESETRGAYFASVGRVVDRE
jgi:arylsulfatase B